MEPWIYRPVIGNSHHFDEDRDPHKREKWDPDPHFSENNNPEPHKSDADLQPCS